MDDWQLALLSRHNLAAFRQQHDCSGGVGRSSPKFVRLLSRLLPIALLRFTSQSPLRDELAER
jgi:hypothetical protein